MTKIYNFQNHYSDTRLLEFIWAVDIWSGLEFVNLSKIWHHWKSKICMSLFLCRSIKIYYTYGLIVDLMPNLIIKKSINYS